VILVGESWKVQDFDPCNLTQAITEDVGDEDDGGFGLRQAGDVGLESAEVVDDLTHSAGRVQRRRALPAVRARHPNSSLVFPNCRVLPLELDWSLTSDKDWHQVKRTAGESRRMFTPSRPWTLNFCRKKR